MGKFIEHMLLNEAKKNSSDNEEEKYKFVDPNEIMVACFCLMNKSDFKSSDLNGKAQDDILSILQKLNAIASSNKIVGANSNEVKSILEMSKLKEVASSASAAYSAAAAIRDKFGEVPTYVILTGRSWAKDIAKYSGIENLLKFGIDSHGMKDFNSSDIVLTTKSTVANEATSKKKPFFVGVSLKKMGTTKSAGHPTITNVSVGAQLKDVADRQEELEVNENVVERLNVAASDFYNRLLKDNADKFLTKNSSENGNLYEKLFKSKTFRKENPEVVSIDDVRNVLKKKCTNATGSDWKNLFSSSTGIMATHENREIVRSVVNDALKRSGSYFKEILRAVEEYSDELAYSLIKMIYKDDLSVLGEYDFDFALCIGKGDVSNGKCRVGTAEYLSIETISSAICQLSASRQGKPRLERSKKQGDFEGEGLSAAKLFFDLYIGSHRIAEIEIRYKGSFTSEPQFFSTMSKEFAKYLETGEW